MHNDERFGYKRPPKEHQFKPGRSGNPKGRPKGSRSLPDVVRAALGKTITVTEEGRRRRITVVEATMHRLVERALAKGDLRAIQHILSLADTFGTKPAAAALPAEDEALITAALRRLQDGADE